MKIKLCLQRIHMVFLKMPDLLFILLMVLSKYLVIIIFSPLFYITSSIGEESGPDSIYETPLLAFVIVVVIAPIIETFFFQKSVINLLKKVTALEKRLWLQIIISAMIFGVLHWYSLSYIIFGFLQGLIFAYAYTLFESKHSNPFWNVVYIHGLSNLVSLVIYYIDSGTT